MLAFENVLLQYMCYKFSITKFTRATCVRNMVEKIMSEFFIYYFVIFIGALSPTGLTKPYFY